MNIFELSQKFSKDLKIAKANYIFNNDLSLQTPQYYLNSFEKIDLSELDNDNKKKVFWINTYNGLTNYLIIKKRLKVHMKEDVLFFKSYRIKIGAYFFSLDDIEHGLLRKNARKHIKNNDPRLQLQLKNLDSRIHFALNCGAKSCPAIANYTLDNIDKELRLAESTFLKEEFIIDHHKKMIRCSEIFVWYREDFVDMYLNNPKLEDYMIQTIPYDWSI